MLQKSSNAAQSYLQVFLATCLLHYSIIFSVISVTVSSAPVSPVQCLLRYSVVFLCIFGTVSSPLQNHLLRYIWYISVFCSSISCTVSSSVQCRFLVYLRYSIFSNTVSSSPVYLVQRLLQYSVVCSSTFCTVSSSVQCLLQYSIIFSSISSTVSSSVQCRLLQYLWYSVFSITVSSFKYSAFFGTNDSTNQLDF